ncbi:MAG: helix-turn-helix domain-containing protein, partial [Pseudonocardia sp.]
MSDDTGQEGTMTDEVTLEGLRVDLDRQRAALGRRLADCREAAELSQAGLGRAIGETRTSVSKVENGRRGR